MEIQPAILLNRNRGNGSGCRGCITGFLKITFVIVVMVIVATVLL